MGIMSAAGRGAGKWSIWGRIIAIAELALVAKRHLDKLGPGEVGELRRLLVKSKGRPGNLTPRERARIQELATKLEPGAFAKDAASSFVPFKKSKT
jgi:hypothetical protein